MESLTPRLCQQRNPLLKKSHLFGCRESATGSCGCGSAHTQKTFVKSWERLLILLKPLIYLQTQKMSEAKTCPSWSLYEETDLKRVKQRARMPSLTT